MHLLETSLPTRFYLPLSHTTQSLLKPSAKGTRTLCPYKGEAEYYDVHLPDGTVLPDLVWYYSRPLMECATIAGLVCFYGEKVDISLDGERVQRPGSWVA